MQKQPNVLIFVTDQHKSIDCGCAGNSIIHPPTFNRLVALGHGPQANYNFQNREY